MYVCIECGFGNRRLRGCGSGSDKLGATEERDGDAGVVPLEVLRPAGSSREAEVREERRRLHRRHLFLPRGERPATVGAAFKQLSIGSVRTAPYLPTTALYCTLSHY